MSVFSCLWEKLSRFKQHRKFKMRSIEEKRHLGGDFYVEHMDANDDLVLQHVQARKLISRDGQLYLYGWCETLPAFRCLPVDRIVHIADDQTGEIIPRNDVPFWLVRRTVN